MSFAIKITLRASRDEEEAYNYYEDIQTGLGEEFLEELHQKYISLSAHPEFYSYVDHQKMIRDVKVDRFPYVIIFEIEKVEVIILAVHNTYKRPPYP